MIVKALVAVICLAVLNLAGIKRSAGEPLSDPVVGPMLVCFKYSIFSLLPGERITDFFPGIEGMSIKVEGDHGTFVIGESEILKPPTNARHLVLRQSDTSVYRIDGAKPRYSVYGRPRFSRDQDRMMILLSGPSLRGTADDAEIYRRLQVRDTEGAACKRTFTYSMSFMFKPN